jgi:hypothetical protein
MVAGLIANVIARQDAADYMDVQFVSSTQKEQFIEEESELFIRCPRIADITMCSGNQRHHNLYYPMLRSATYSH